MFGCKFEVTHFFFTLNCLSSTLQQENEHNIVSLLQVVVTVLMGRTKTRKSVNFVVGMTLFVASIGAASRGPLRS